MRGTWQTTDNGGGPAGAVVVLLIFIALGLRAVWPEIVKTVEVIAWTVAGVTGAALAVAVGVLVARVVARVRRVRRARRAARVVTPARPVLRVVRDGEVRPLPQSRQEIEAARPRGSASWPLPGWWEDIRTRIGSDDDDSRPR